VPPTPQRTRQARDATKDALKRSGSICHRLKCQAIHLCFTQQILSMQSCQFSGE
jgi:hypothetical protein